MENPNITTNAHGHAATATSSDLQHDTGNGAEAGSLVSSDRQEDEGDESAPPPTDQEKQDYSRTADLSHAPKGDQPPVGSSDDNDQTGSLVSSDRQEDEGDKSAPPPTDQEKQDYSRTPDLSKAPKADQPPVGSSDDTDQTDSLVSFDSQAKLSQDEGHKTAPPPTVQEKQENSGLAYLSNAPKGDQPPVGSSDDNDQTDSLVSSDRQEDEGDKSAPPPTDQEKQDYSRTADLSQSRVSSDLEAKPSQGRKTAHPPTVQEKQDLSSHLPMIMVVLGISVIIGLCVYFNGSNARPDPREDSVDIFRREFDKMKPAFPGQRPELWKRSRIHLEEHLQMASPTEPVSMILTSGRRAERTLHCLASRMAAAFSSALGASVLHIDGASRASLESDQVKMDIDEQLTEAFEGDRRAAVVHRFEELPPGSTLIFYRYCDHENAAYKGTFLTFTVLLQEDELKSHLSLNTVEEIVQEHLQDKFLFSTHPAGFDKMDVDKLSGLWSRISHLILPVAAEESIEKHGCNI
ncbi:torsin-1A-interacting protein 2-like isoform X2 [Conger conger]|uniref:torsin-1A-interacting protein 2-like isoform X2 n=1 Tax=Conger conger TaxID=82655 RepID=UPI002A59C17A|nr:torsin-1A-interacting protein 2-like isoform X2 [Conger conger]